MTVRAQGLGHPRNGLITQRPYRYQGQPGWDPSKAGDAERMPCGTDAGYQRHRKDGEPICPRCREAHNARVRIARKARTA